MTAIKGLKEHRVTDVTMGPTHSAVVTSTGRVYTFGRNSEGQLGTGYAVESSHITFASLLKQRAMVDY